MKIWFVDVPQKQAMLSAKTMRGISKHADMFGGLKGSDLQVVAVANGLRDTFKDFFAPYATKPKDKPTGTGG